MKDYHIMIKAGKIIEQARKRLGFGRPQLAELCGFSHQKLYHLEIGRDSLRLEYVEPLCKHLQITPEELIGQFLGDLNYSDNSSIHVRYYHNTYISAGYGAYVGDNEDQEYITLSKSFIKRLTNANEKDLSIVNIDGDSMEPTLRTGDQVIVDHSWSQQSEGIYALHIDGTDYIKRLVFLGGKVQIISDNQVYPVKECEANEVHIHGRVIWFGRSLAVKI